MPYGGGRPEPDTLPPLRAPWAAPSLSIQEFKGSSVATGSSPAPPPGCRPLASHSSSTPFASQSDWPTAALHLCAPSFDSAGRHGVRGRPPIPVPRPLGRGTPLWASHVPLHAHLQHTSPAGELLLSAQHLDKGPSSSRQPLFYGPPTAYYPELASSGVYPSAPTFWPSQGELGQPDQQFASAPTLLGGDFARATTLLQSSLISAVDGPINKGWVDLLSPLGSGDDLDVPSPPAQTDRPASNAEYRDAYVLAPPASSVPGRPALGVDLTESLAGDSSSTITQASDDADGKVAGPTEDPPAFDVYADTFIPAYLRDLHRYPPTCIHLSTSLPPFPPADYVTSFYPPTLLAPRTTTRMLGMRPPSARHNLVPLEAPTYGTWFTQLLALELAARSKRGRSLILYKLPVVLLDAGLGNKAGALISVHVPGVRENWPQVSVGDSCLLREVWVNRSAGSAEGLMGRVISVGKRQGHVYVRVPSLIAYLSSTSYAQHHSFLAAPLDASSTGDLVGAFNILFFPSPLPILEQATAVDLVGSLLCANLKAPALPSNGQSRRRDTGQSSQDQSGSVLRRWLFPEPSDAKQQKAVLLDVDIGNDSWIDPGLNEEQRNAVRVGALYRSRVPLLISGPFGTGKTKMVTELALQILRLQSTATVLLVAPSNSATDTLCLRLREAFGSAAGLGQRSAMLRLNDRERTFAEVPDAILPFCCTEGDHFAVPSFAQLMKYRLVLTSATDAAILLRARVSNRDLGAIETGVTSTIHPHDVDSEHSVRPHWTHLIIDEAGQGSEPEVLVPISVVLPFSHTSTEHEPQLVLCGDGQQLGPLICSDAARNGELDVSLLERLFERPLYATSMGPSNGDWRPCTRLVKNYRCHPALLMTPSSLFYDNALEPCARNGIVRWSKLPNADLPLVVMNTPGLDGSLDEGASWYNIAEINQAVAVVRSLLDPAESAGSTPPIRMADIGIMAGFREQVWRLRERLRSEGFGGIDVGSVEDYQGREKRITIVSTVRSRVRFLQRDIHKSLGLVFEQKRFNVSITRARELLVIIGSAEILARDPSWRGLLHFALRNGLFVGPEIALEATNDFMSALESDYLADLEARHAQGSRSGQEVDGSGSDDGESAWEAADKLNRRSARLSGALARSVLHEGDGGR